MQDYIIWITLIPSSIMGTLSWITVNLELTVLCVIMYREKNKDLNELYFEAMNLDEQNKVNQRYRL